MTLPPSKGRASLSDLPHEVKNVWTEEATDDDSFLKAAQGHTMQREGTYKACANSAAQCLPAVAAHSLPADPQMTHAQPLPFCSG